MVFKDLQKLVPHSQQQQKENTSKELFQRLQGKPFWIWNLVEHKQENIRTNRDCCLIISLVYHRRMEMINHSMTMRE
ncbi:MAG: hypothetical protein ACJ71C_01560 [Nitrososphaeraceae archaeon]